MIFLLRNLFCLLSSSKCRQVHLQAAGVHPFLELVPGWSWNISQSQSQSSLQRVLSEFIRAWLP